MADSPIRRLHRADLPVARGVGQGANLEWGAVQPDQGPPLWTPLSFFLLASIAIVTAGAVIVWHGEGLTARWSPITMAEAHLGTLGFIGAVMFGAFYQMLPVVAGAPVPLIRLSHVTLGGLASGLGALVLGFLNSDPRMFRFAGFALSAALACFLIPVGWALARAKTNSTTVNGMRLALCGLILVVALGLLMANAHAGRGVVRAWRATLYIHLGVGGLVWIGGLLIAVSWQILPMFYMCAPVARWLRTFMLVAVSLSALASVAVIAGVLAPGAATYALVPAVIAVWAMHPVISLAQLHARKRRRSDVSVRYWQAGLCCALVALVAAAAVQLFDDARLPVLLGWTALWGWAGLIVHGMLTRIVPFLVWFHRYAPDVGIAPVVPMRRLLPQGHARLGLWVHLATLAIGWSAIATSTPWIQRATGLGMIATGLLLASEVLRVASHVLMCTRPRLQET